MYDTVIGPEHKILVELSRLGGYFKDLSPEYLKHMLDKPRFSGALIGQGIKSQLFLDYVRRGRGNDITVIMQNKEGIVAGDGTLDDTLLKFRARYINPDTNPQSPYTHSFEAQREGNSYRGAYHGIDGTSGTFVVHMQSHEHLDVLKVTLEDIKEKNLQVFLSQ